MLHVDNIALGNMIIDHVMFCTLRFYFRNCQNSRTKCVKTSIDECLFCCPSLEIVVSNKWDAKFSFSFSWTAETVLLVRIDPLLPPTGKPHVCLWQWANQNGPQEIQGKEEAGPLIPWSIKQERSDSRYENLLSFLKQTWGNTSNATQSCSRVILLSHSALNCFCVI